ncbi:MAG: DNA repair protein RadA [Lachnospiraceae bacterium]|nr:DNA repair protein RadA [Candidatus Merdinaster equi]
MAKEKRQIAYFCQNCGHESAKWMGQCPSCKEWNTFVEEKIVGITSGSDKNKSGLTSGSKAKPVSISEVEIGDEERISSGIGELDRVLGGGIVPGCLVLVGGDPGIGKSTLLLQVCQKLTSDEDKAAARSVLYISGEESLQQIKLRAERIGKSPDTLKFLCETNLEIIEEILKDVRPQVVVIDSIQTMFSESSGSAPGSVSQVREATGILLRLAKSYQISIFIVGHVTKEGTVAGPRVLEHMVDTVLYFEGDRHASYRILRGVKNRFGSTNEIGVFEMREEGLCEVTNPSEFMLSGRPEKASGSIVSCSIEGTRPILTEVQALVSRSNFGIPRRQAIGTDLGRVNLLMAVLEKRVELHTGDCDAYVNLAGGIRITEPALDLGIALAVASSFKNRVIDEKTVAFGEVGLSGEVRSVNMAQQRINEAAKLGFTRCLIPYVNLKNLRCPDEIEVIGVKSVSDAIEICFR